MGRGVTICSMLPLLCSDGLLYSALVLMRFEKFDHLLHGNCRCLFPSPCQRRILLVVEVPRRSKCMSPSCICWGGFCNGILKAIGVIGKAHLRLRQFKMRGRTSALSFLSPSNIEIQWNTLIMLKDLKSVANTQMI